MKTAKKRLRPQLILMCGLMLLLTWSLVAYDLIRSRSHYLEQANLRTNLQSQVSAEYAQSVVKRIDEILMDMRNGWNGSAREFADLVLRRQENLEDMSFQVAVLDKDGMMQFSSLSKQSEKMDLSMREYFRVHRDMPDSDTLFISKPVKENLSDKWSLQFTRPLLKQGKFDGVLVVSVSPDQLTFFAKKFNVSGGGIVSVLRDSGELMARYPAAETMLGKVMDTRLLTSLTTPSLSGNFHRLASSDDVERIYAYYRLPGYQLTFLVGESVDQVLLPYAAHRNEVLGGATLISLCAMLLFGMLHRALNARDETQQHLSQQLSQQETILRQSQELAQTGSYSLDIESMRFNCSDSMTGIFGLPSGFEKTFENWLQVVSPADRLTVCKIMTEAIVQVGRYSCEYKIVRPTDARECWIQAFGEIIQDAAHQSSYLAGIVLDVTEQRQREEELQAVKEMAAETDIARSLYQATVSHEIRTPMNGILGMTDLVLDTNLNRDQRQYLNMIKSSAESLMTVMDDILDSSKMAAGKLALESVVFDLPSLLDEAVWALAIPAEQKGLELVADIDVGRSHAVKGDPARIRQILFNVVTNAIKFTDHGSVVIHVRQDALPGGDVLLHCKVTDTGIGIAQDKIASIFDSFSQLDKSITRKHGGTGLGLSISSRLVKMMQGRIWAESETGHGSTFHFVVRLMKGGPSQLMPTPVSLPNRKVLLVDDSPANRQFLVNCLQKIGIQPVTAETAQEALNEMGRARRAGSAYDLLLLDAHMPDMDGFALRTRMAEVIPPLTSKIIMMTSAIVSADADRCRKAGIELYMNKPVRPHDLSTALMHAFGMDRDDTASTLAKPDGKPRFTKSLSILVAEDNLINQQLAAKLLEKAGHSVKICNNGKEALSLIEAEKFDLVLMDVQMPVMDGIQACMAIRAREATHGDHLPVIAVTANVMDGDKERCLAAGMDEYLSKPIQAKKLMDCIASVLKQQTFNMESTMIPVDTVQLLPEFDYARALDKTDEEVLEIVGKLALSNIPMQIADIAHALGTGHLQDTQRAAHTMKGIIAYFGATPIVECARKMELCAMEGDLDKAGQHFQLLETETEKFLPYLLAKLKKSNNA
ncbi:response regulator [Undibacterium sp. Ji50W]|uniref:response regulator n=1 Tax=Undibacterium sp. Ji50W TaxID=3413041 RepID=UPI003BF23FC6